MNEELYVENPWIQNRKYKPDCNDPCIVKDRDGGLAIARYEPSERLWFTDQLEVVDVVKWMTPPEDD